MTDLGSRNERGHALYHAQTCTQDRDECQLMTGYDLGLCHADRGLHLDLLQGKVTGRLVADEHCGLGNQLTELLGTGVLIPHQRDLVLDQRMVDDM